MTNNNNYVKKYEVGNIKLESPYAHYNYAFPLLSFGDAMHTVNLSLVFSSRLINQNPFYMSNGYKLSLQKRLIFANEIPNEYEDGDGSRVKLLKQGDADIYTFNDDSQRIIRKADMSYVLENPDYSTETYSLWGRIISVKSKYGDTILSYEYYGNLLTSIKYREGTKAINIVYNNTSVNSIKYLCNGETAFEIGLAYSGTAHVVVNHPSGVTYYHAYSANTFTAYSSTPNASYSHKVECTKINSTITMKQFVGTKIIDKTTYNFIGYDETEGINIVDIVDFQGVTTRVQYDKHKPAYSYEKLGMISRGNESSNEEYYPGTITYYNNKNATGSQKYNDGLIMDRVTDTQQVDYNRFSVMHNLSGMITVSGWLRANESFNECSITVYAGNTAASGKIKRLVKDEWKYFSVSVETQTESPFVTAITSENDVRLSAMDFRVTSQSALVSDGNGYKDNIIAMSDVLFYTDSSNCEHIIPLSAVKFYDGATELSNEDYEIKSTDIMRYKINRFLGKHHDEIYYNDCKGVLLSTNYFIAKFKINNNDDYEDPVNVMLLSVGKIQATKNKTLITKSSPFVENGVVEFKTEVFSGTSCIKYEIYDNKFDLIESSVDGIKNYYTRKSNTGLVTKHTIKDANDSNEIATTATYDSNNNLIKTVNEFGTEINYTVDPIWGTISISTVEDGISVVDSYDEDKTTLLSKKFEKGSDTKLHTFEYSEGRLSSVETDNLKYLFNYSEGSNSTISTVSKSTVDKVIETIEVADDQRTVSAFYPTSGSGMIHSVVEHRDKYNRVTGVDGKITNTYDLDSYIDTSSLDHIITGIDNASSKLISSTDHVTGSTKTIVYENDLPWVISNSESDYSLARTEQFDYDIVNRLTKNALRYSDGRSFESVIGYVNNESHPMPDNMISTYTYRLLNGENVEKEVQTAYTYDGYKRVSTKSSTLATNPFVKTFNYDKTRINSVSDTFSSFNKGTNSYTYDDYGRIVTDTYTSETTNNYGKYTYDSFGQLVREDNQALDKTYVYEYNGIGNITKVHTCPYTTGAVSEDDYASTVEYKYTNTTHPDRLTNFNGKSIIYNSIGYPTNYDGKTWTWNDGKLTRIHKGSESQPGSKYENCTFTYDGYGRRIRKHYVYDPNPAVAGDGHYYYTTNYSYDESDRLVKEYITEYRDTGVTTTRELIYLYDASGIIGVSYSVNGGTPATYYYRKNAQGDVTAIYDANGNRRAEYAYDAWGNCKILYGASTLIAGINPIRYRGYYYDRETGLYYLNARYYNPEWRRFISPDDTAYLDPESVNGLNLYAYCNNDPVNYADPSGRGAVAVLIVGFIIGAALGFAMSVSTQFIDNNFDIKGINPWLVVSDTIFGGINGLLASSGIGTLMSAFLGASLGGLQEVVSSIIEGEEINKFDVLTAAAIGLVGALIPKAGVSAKQVSGKWSVLKMNINGSVGDRRFYMYTAKLTRLKRDVAICGMNYIVSTVGSSVAADHISNFIEGYYYGY